MIWAIVRTTFERLHWYGAAPEPVQFLRAEHRHLFHATAHVEQKHDDRDVEYFLLKKELERIIDSTIPLVSPFSCEMMAGLIKTELERTYPGRKVKVEVSEDGENGALVE